MEQDKQKMIRLNNGQFIPLIGLGTYNMDTKTAEETIYTALTKGYRLIDSAAMYENEAEVGRAVRRAVKNGISREEITVVTKIWKTDLGYEKTLRAFEKSYETMNLDVIDLVLIHWPDAANEVNIKTWKALEEIYYSGKVKAIGVSNFDEEQLNYLFEWGDIKPVVNQYSCYPGKSQESLRVFCEKSGIRSMAYSPIHRGKTVDDKDIQRLAEKYQKTPAQIALRWNIQRGVIPIPKTESVDRLDENLNIFDFTLSENEMSQLLAKG
ncbi:aldo/keto reductase [Desemzia sp. RIT804]|uniref:aldo/keto reductase n=1 Tax=Desemzia sp. RIT 804 TaxID=2810209 RepID=UPI0019518B1D|nr:aldo/keto reductase [Desemzia sp. RIT 804]MBM6613292.1 aldo/keto reductase [Desemzia sp. RIT 804]